MHHNFIRIYGGCDASLRKKDWLITFQKKGCRFSFARRGLTATRSGPRYVCHHIVLVLCGLTATRSGPRYVRHHIVFENTVFVLRGLTSTRSGPRYVCHHIVLVLCGLTATRSGPRYVRHHIVFCRLAARHGMRWDS